LLIESVAAPRGPRVAQRLADARKGVVDGVKNARAAARRAFRWTKNIYYNVRKLIAESRLKRDKALREACTRIQAVCAGLR
jgi:hypothetical protein